MKRERGNKKEIGGDQTAGQEGERHVAIKRIIKKGLLGEVPFNTATKEVRELARKISEGRGGDI